MEYSVKEVSEKLGITIQAIYKRMNKNYAFFIQNNYVIEKSLEKDGIKRTQKFITEDGLKYLTPKPKKLNSTTYETKNKPKEKNYTKSVNTSNETNNREIIELLKSQIEKLESDNKELKESLKEEHKKTESLLLEIININKNVIPLLDEIKNKQNEEKQEKKGILKRIFKK